MSDTVILTYIYNEFWGTEQFRKSVERTGLPLVNFFTAKEFKGNAEIMRMQYDCLVKLRDRYKYAIYSDGADTYFFRGFTPPDGVIIYSAEAACYPIEAMAAEYKDKQTRWCYLNAGNWCGEIELMIKFIEKYGLHRHHSDINGQKEIAEAYLKAVNDGFPIMLDQQCKYFQSIAFEEEGEFTLTDEGVKNNVTGNTAATAHGNGRTNMDKIYKYYE